MKKLIAVLLAVLFAVCFASCDEEGKADSGSNNAEKHTYVSGICTDCGKLEPSEGFEFRPVLDETGKTVAYSVSGMGNCTDTELVFPDSHENLPVVSVLYDAFYNNTSIVSITLPEGFTEIGASAFKGCDNLKSIALPSTLKTISGFAFQNCKALTEITLPEGTEIIDKQSFSGCSSLTTVNFPSTLVEIGYMAFMECTNLDKVFIKEGTKKIGEFAFEKCQNMYEMTLPASLEFIGAGAFDGCISLINQKYAGTVEQFKAIELGGGINNENPILCSDGSIKRLYSNTDKELGRW